MSRSQAGVFVVWVVTVVVLGALVFSVIPALARTIFRARLDSIRDQCMDHVLAGRLSTSPPVEEFLASLAVQNRVARQITLLRVTLIVRELRRINTDLTHYHGVSFASLEPSERKILHDLARRVNWAMVRYLVWGSPIGWLTAPLVVLGQHLLERARRSNPLRVDRVAEDFNRAGAFNDLRDRPRLTRAA